MVIAGMPVSALLGPGRSPAGTGLAAERAMAPGPADGPASALFDAAGLASGPSPGLADGPAGSSGSAYALAAVALALAVCCWPWHPVRLRLAALAGPGDGRARRFGGRGTGSRRRRVRWVVPPVLLSGLLGLLLAGPGGAVAAALAGGVATHRWAAARLTRRRTRELAVLLDAVGVLTSELRAGAHPAAAARVAADAVAGSAVPGPATRPGHQPPAIRSAVARAGGTRYQDAGRSGTLRAYLGRSGVATGGIGRPGRPDPGTARCEAADSPTVVRVLAAVAAGAGLGAEVPDLLRRHAAADPALGGELRRIAGAWSLAERHGVALAELLDTVRADLQARHRLAGQIGAQLAGPRSTAAVLAGLPVFGVLLGQGSGADPWHILTATAAGQLLLVLGTVLSCAGILWSGRITSRAVAA